MLAQEDLQEVKKEAKTVVKDAVRFTDTSPDPPADLAKDLEYPTAIDTDYNAIPPPVFADSVNARTILPCKMAIINTHISALRKKAEAGQITISDAVNLAIHEEMLRDPSTTSNFTTSSLMFD